MSKIFSPIARVFSNVAKNESGTQLVETAVWIGIITVSIVTAISGMNGSLSTVYTRIASLLTTAAG